MMLSQMLTKDKEAVQYAAENLSPQVSSHCSSKHSTGRLTDRRRARRSVTEV